MNAVVVPVFDRYTQLRWLMQSLEPLEELGWAVILSIDPPYDPTIEHVFKKRNPLYTLWNRATYGIGWNHYRGITYAFNKLKAETVCVIDADMALTKDAHNLLEWFAGQDKYLGLSLLSPRLMYNGSDSVLLKCGFFSRFQLTCHRDMWYKYIQPVWMRCQDWDEPFADVVMDSRRFVLHPEKARVICNGTENSTILSMEEHGQILEGVRYPQGTPSGSYVVVEGAEAIRR